MDKDRPLYMMVASAALVFSTSCTPHQSVKPIEIKGPLVDTPQIGYSPWGKRTITPKEDKPKEQSVPGSDADLVNRIEKIHSDLKALDNSLKPFSSDGGQ
jgi:hypothetical protein